MYKVFYIILAWSVWSESSLLLAKQLVIFYDFAELQLDTLFV